jgi:YD repeat-containing protein
MLTRLRVSGFKNLVDVDISFGPFTCIAGANGVGKSNLLDAIVFLSALADGPLLDAALSVRDQGAKTGDIRGLFHHVGDHFDEEMAFEAEMIIPERGTDDLGQEAKATATFVQYAVSLRYKRDESARALGSLELIKEELKHITLGEAAQHLPFSPSRAWRKRVVKNERRTPKYISTEGMDADRVINVHQDGGSSGKPQKLRAANLPRTVLSAANSAESPTATLVKREMQSWRLLQLEPSSLREPDNFTAPVELDSDGAHLPATLFHLANATNGPSEDSAAVYAEVANRLSQLIDDVRSVHVDRDERRQLLTIYAMGRDGTSYPARALSDGTLRFLALTVLSIEPNSRGVICLEEPENGIHPQRIPAMIQLLRDLTTDVQEQRATGTSNQLRQIIINTHSPSVVMQVPDDSLLMAEPVEISRSKASFKALQLRCLPGTWREKGGKLKPISKGQLLAYLNPVSHATGYGWDGSGRESGAPDATRSRRVIDREDLRQYKIPFSEISE